MDEDMRRAQAMETKAVLDEIRKSLVVKREIFDVLFKRAGIDTAMNDYIRDVSFLLSIVDGKREV